MTPKKTPSRPLRNVISKFSKPDTRYVYIVNSQNGLFEPFTIVWFNGRPEFSNEFRKRNSQKAIDAIWDYLAANPTRIDEGVYSIRCG